MALTDKLTAIANAIRGKTGKSGTLTLEQMPGEIASISGETVGTGGISYKVYITEGVAGVAETVESLPSPVVSITAVDYVEASN